jgi:hypothetical protein
MPKPLYPLGESVTWASDPVATNARSRAADLASVRVTERPFPLRGAITRLASIKLRFDIPRSDGGKEYAQKFEPEFTWRGF